MDQGSFERLGKTMRKAKTPNRLGLRQVTVSVVNATTPPTYDLTIDNDVWEGVICIVPGYAPQVAETVWILINGPDALIIGKQP